MNQIEPGKGSVQSIACATSAGWLKAAIAPSPLGGSALHLAPGVHRILMQP